MQKSGQIKITWDFISNRSLEYDNSRINDIR